MRLFRTLPTGRLLILLGSVVCVLVLGVAIALAAGGPGPVPPPKPLPEAVHDALAAPPPPGVSARISFTNGLLPSSALTGQAGSPLLTGATGRLWLTNDGRGRLELQSSSGDAQIVWNRGRVSLYDGTSNTAYELSLPARTDGKNPAAKTPPTTADIASAIAKLGADWTLTGAQPTDVAGHAAYDVRLTPKGNGGLLSAVEVAWDALRGVPLELALYAKGTAAPVLAFKATDISFGAVPDSVVDVSPPTGAKVVEVPTPAMGTGGASAVTGLDAVQARLPFHVTAPDRLGDLTRTSVRLVGHGDGAGALIVYGKGLGAVAVLERPAASPGSAGSGGGLDSLPTVTIGGVQAHELSTPLGTILTWKQGSIVTLLAGSITAATAEADAAALG